MKIKELFDHYKLGEIIGEPTMVIGGLMHSMYDVRTPLNRYAVKKLNPVIMQRDGVLHHITMSENIGILFNGIVPVIPAMKVGDKPVVEFEGEYYIVFNWTEGGSVFPPNITSSNCSYIGDILGKIHSADITITGLTKDTLVSTRYEWDKYFELGQESNKTWLNDLVEVIDELKVWNEKLIIASSELNKKLVISHRDLDPKNVMWYNSEPYLIDWEAAGYVNPYQELLEVLNYWSDNGDGTLNREKFFALYNVYKAYDMCDTVNWEDVIYTGYGGMLGWLDYSFKRSLGLEADNEEEMNLGTEQVFGTIKALKKYEQNVSVLKSWLEYE